MTGLLAAVSGMALAIVADLVAARVGLARTTCYAASLLAGLCASGLSVFLLSPDDMLVSLAIAILAYGSWWYAFLNLVQSLESSLRVRLLGEVRAAGGSMPVTALQAIYNDAFLLRLRLERLMAHGAVVERNGHLFVLSPGLKAIAAIFRTLKTILLGRLSEFESPLK